MKLFGFTIERENKKVDEVIVDGTAEEIEVDPNQKKFNGKKLALAIGVGAVIGGVVLALANKGHSDDSDPETTEDPEEVVYDSFGTENVKPNDDPEVEELTRLENETEG